MKQRKYAVAVEVIGEPGVGKTHACACNDNLLYLDTSDIGEAELIVEKLHPNENIDDIYVHCQSLRDIQSSLRSMSETTKLVVIDSSSVLRTWAADEWKSRKKRDGVMPYEYDEVDAILKREILYPIVREKQKNLMLTSMMKDEWVDDKRTGKRERKGYVHLEFICDIRVLMYVENGVRKNLIIKNRMVDQQSKDYVKSLTEVNLKNIFDITKLPQEKLVI